MTTSELNSGMNIIEIIDEYFQITYLNNGTIETDLVLKFRIDWHIISRDIKKNWDLRCSNFIMKGKVDFCSTFLEFLVFPRHGNASKTLQ